MRYKKVLLLTLFSIAAANFAAAQCKVKKQADKCVISNDKIKLTLDAKKNYIIKSLSKVTNNVSYLNELQMVADLEKHTKAGWVGFRESYAPQLSHDIKQDKSSVIVSVKWRNKYIETKKTIELRTGEPFVRVKYDTFFFQKLPLRLLAVPAISFPSWMNRCSFKNKFGKIIKNSTPPWGGKKKLTALSPGFWYATGNTQKGLLVVLPGLTRDYKMFSWPPEWGYGKHLLRNYNIGKPGLVFPHRTAFKALGDDRLSAEIILAPYSGSPKKTAQEILKKCPSRSLSMDKIPLNNAARYLKPNDNLTVWTDYSQGIHLRNRKLPETEKLTGSFEIAGAKNQTVPFQVIIRPSAACTLQTATLKGINFKNEIRLHRYIKLSEPSSLFQRRSIKEYPVEWPDPLMPFKPTECPKDKNQGIWISINIPAAAAAGMYDGKVELIFKNGDTVNVPVKLKVFDFVMPKTRSYKNICDIGLYFINYRKVGSANDPELQFTYAKTFKDFNLSPNDTINGFKPHIRKWLSEEGAIINVPRQDAMVSFEGSFAVRFWNGKHVRYSAPGMTYDKFMDIIKQTYKKDIKKIRDAGVKGKIYATACDGALLNNETKNATKTIIEEVRATGVDINFVGCIKNNVTPEILKMLDTACTVIILSKSQRKMMDEALDSGIIKERWTYLNNYLAIDSPPVALRSLYWEQYFRRISGNWNWGGISAYWGNKIKDPYTPKVNELLGGIWGLGALVYPPIKPAEDKRPVPSIRIYQQMCGMDDYEYLKKFDQLISQMDNKSAEYQNAVDLKRKIQKFSIKSLNTREFSKINVEESEQLRRQLGQAIENKK